MYDQEERQINKRGDDEKNREKIKECMAYTHYTAYIVISKFLERHSKAKRSYGTSL